MLDTARLETETAYERRLLHMVCEELDWCSRSSEFRVRGVNVYSIGNRWEATAFEGPSVPVLRPSRWHLQSPAPWIRQFLPLILTGAHKLLEMTFTWVAEENGVQVGHLTAGTKYSEYVRALTAGRVTLPDVWQCHSSIHAAILETWHAFLPVRNDQVHRGGIVVGDWGELTLRSTSGPHMLREDDVGSFALLAVHTLDSLLQAAGTCGNARSRAGVVASLDALSAIVSLVPFDSPAEWWTAAEIYCKRSDLSKLVVPSEQIRNLALATNPPRPDELQRFEIIVEVREGQRTERTQIPEHLLAVAQNVRWHERDRQWASA
jgi:hypothetical protein